MNIILKSVFSVTLAVFAVQVSKAEADKPLKVLMIGNSFSVQMPNAMPPMARSRSNTASRPFRRARPCSNAIMHEHVLLNLNNIYSHKES